MATFGVAVSLLGTLFGFPAMRARLQVDVLRMGELSSLFVIGIWCATVLAGPLADYLGNKVVLAISSLIVAGGFLGLAGAASFAWAGVAAFLLGFGAGGLNTAISAVVSGLSPDGRAVKMNLVGIFCSAGAVSAPLLAAGISPQAAILFGAGLATVAAVMFLTLSLPEPQNAQSFSLPEVLRIVTYPAVLLIAGTLFFESLSEQALTSFTSTWVETAGATARTATGALLGYQAGMALGRMGAVPLLRRVPQPLLVMAWTVGGLAGTIVLLSQHTVAGMILGVVISSLSMAAIYPTLVSFAGDCYPRFAGTVMATVFAIAMLGGIISPTVVGEIGKNLGVRQGTIVPVVGSLAVSCLMVAVLRSRGAGRPRAPEMAAEAVTADTNREVFIEGPFRTK
jgi:MFS family permease